MEGILPLHKPAGMTSHDCVGKMRRILKLKRIGHTGTLDPSVTGVLPLCIGRATKVAQYMSDYSKTYEAEVTLGTATTTEDADGDVIEKKELNRVIHLDELKNVLQSMSGTIEQIPPMYSAVKVNGKRLYEYAFEGKEVERPKRQVTIYEMTLLTDAPLTLQNPSFRIRVTCSKGTYIRTLAVDIGEKLGFPAHMSSLIRTKSGPFSLEESLTFEEIENAVEAGTFSEHLFPTNYAVQHFEKLVVSDEQAVKILNGAVLPLPKLLDALRFSVYNQSNELLAIYQPHPTKVGLMKPEKVFNANE
ncbi:tRNA pseudouridine(55) synthase TruB [Bacillus taeanensis]|uniref:tRNA pseudouridine synthase B n=1 Tax=Bacillus taeanensis TaxID=273032 RepID=A0A366XZ25_9BACI|nr:tRNA pseudouridine(55) synthase TruB [Bacillus taeanensis]RBW70019.1 tRNA pseudouridine(55) synthase TruB [Bacillus taeanensis]